MKVTFMFILSHLLLVGQNCLRQVEIEAGPTWQKIKNKMFLSNSNVSLLLFIWFMMVMSNTLLGKDDPLQQTNSQEYDCIDIAHFPPEGFFVERGGLYVTRWHLRLRGVLHATEIIEYLLPSWQRLSDWL